MLLMSSSYMVAKHLPSALSTRYWSRRREGEAVWFGTVGVHFCQSECLDVMVGQVEVFNVFVLKWFE